jgi:hypothetical protein
MASIYIQSPGKSRRMVVLEGSELIQFREDYERFFTGGETKFGTYNGHDVGSDEALAIEIAFADVAMIL